MARRFNKLGLRRDLNLSDLNDPQQALNNLLNNLAQEQTGDSFIYQDLDPIKNVRTSTIVNDDFRNIAGAALRTTGVNGSLQPYKPTVKLKNRLDINKFTIGEPNFYGGDGLTARYYEASQINSTAVFVDNIFTGTPVATEIFWERGIFDYVGKIQPTLQGFHGGVEWRGSFRPTVNGVWSFGITTTGFCTFEFDDLNGNLAPRQRKSQYEYTFEVAAAAAGATTLQLTSFVNAANLLSADVLIHPTITQFRDPAANGYSGTPVTITSIDVFTGIITLSSPLTLAIASATNFTFRHKVGGGAGSISFSVDNLEAFRTYEIRIRFWVPKETFVNEFLVAGAPIKTISFTCTPPNSQSTYLNYKWLYSENYNTDPTPGTDDYGDFRTFYKYKLTAAGGIVGGVDSYNNYQRIITKAPLSVTYNPPASLAAITKQSKTATITNSSNILSIAVTDNIEVGNYIFGPGIPDGTRVVGISINSGIFMSVNAQATSSSVVTFIDHRGLIIWGSGLISTQSGINGLSSIINQISIGDLVVSASTQTLSTVVAKNLSGVTLSKVPTGTGQTETVYFYRPKGVINNGLVAFCTGVASAPTMVQSNRGSFSLTVAYTTGITPGMKPQFGSRIPAGTTITNIAGNVITMSLALADDIPINQLITFAPNNTPNGESKEICFPPIDTSPPFTATADGMATTSGRPNIEVYPDFGAKGELKFVGLRADGVTVTPTTADASYNRTLLIKDATGTSYVIFATV